MAEQLNFNFGKMCWAFCPFVSLNFNLMSSDKICDIKSKESQPKQRHKYNTCENLWGRQKKLIGADFGRP